VHRSIGQPGRVTVDGTVATDIVAGLRER